MKGCFIAETSFAYSISHRVFWLWSGYITNYWGTIKLLPTTHDSEFIWWYFFIDHMVNISFENRNLSITRNMSPILCVYNIYKTVHRRQNIIFLACQTEFYKSMVIHCRVISFCCVSNSIIVFHYVQKLLSQILSSFLIYRKLDFIKRFHLPRLCLWSAIDWEPPNIFYKWEKLLLYLYTYKTLIILIVWLIDCLLEAVRTNPGYGMATLIYNNNFTQFNLGHSNAFKKQLIIIIIISFRIFNFLRK